jgi:trk system potassium uptake protein TrkH
MTISLWLAGIYIAALLLGLIVIRLPGAMIAGNELSIERAIFTVTNAATLTGFQQSRTIDEYATLGKLCVISLMVIGTLVSLIVGGLAVVRVARMPYSDGQIIRATIITYVLAVFAGAAAIAEPGRGLLVSAVQAASAFGNSGLVLGAAPAIADWRTHVVLMPLAFLGGLGIPVLLDIASALFGQRTNDNPVEPRRQPAIRRAAMSAHASLVLTLSAMLYLLGLFTLAWLGPDSWSSALATGSAQSINARTAGLPLMQISSLSRVAQWILILLMLIGAAPGSTAGGLKVTTLYHLRELLRTSLGRQAASRLSGLALAWTFTYLAIAALTLLCLLAFQPELSGERLLFIAISAISLVGLSQDPVSVTGPGLLILSAAMLLGRILPWIFLWHAARTARSDDAPIAPPIAPA